MPHFAERENALLKRLQPADTEDEFTATTKVRASVHALVRVCVSLCVSVCVRACVSMHVPARRSCANVSGCAWLSARTRSFLFACTCVLDRSATVSALPVSVRASVCLCAYFGALASVRDGVPILQVSLPIARCLLSAAGRGGQARAHLACGPAAAHCCKAAHSRRRRHLGR